jgi:hypothetical protein
MIFKTVGAMSARLHPFFMVCGFHLLMYRQGTGFMLCAVIGASDVHMSSLFP